MFGKKLLCAIAVLGIILIASSMSGSNVKAQSVSYPPNSIWLDPGAINLNQYNAANETRFNVTAWINMNESTFFWQDTIFFNASLLQCTKAGFTNATTGNSNYFSGHSGIIPASLIDNATGKVSYGESLLGTDFRVSGNGSLFWAEFEVIQVPNATVKSLTGSLNDTSADDTFVSDVNGTVIPTANIATAYTFSYITDTTPPTITGTTQFPANGSIADMQSVSVAANVTDEVGGSGVKNVTLYYSTDNVTFSNSTKMNLDAATGLYNGTIPGYAVNTWVYYYIIAYDYAGNMAKDSNVGNYNYLVPEFTSVLMILMLIAMASAVLLMRKKIIR